MNAVNCPGSLYSSAASMFRCQTDLNSGVSGQYIRDSGKLPLANRPIISYATPGPSPALIRSYQSLPCGSDKMLGLPAKRSAKKPTLSEWSDTTSQSSGRDSLTGVPVDATTSSPRAKR